MDSIMSFSNLFFTPFSADIMSPTVRIRLMSCQMVIKLSHLAPTFVGNAICIRFR